MSGRGAPCGERPFYARRSSEPVIREILFDKRYVPDRERPAVQILERARVRFKPKGQLIGIEKLPGFPEALILLVFAILAVSE